MKFTRAEIDAMPLEEKLELFEALWDSIYASTDNLPVPEWHQKLLDESLNQLDPQFDTWENVKERLKGSRGYRSAK